LPPEKFCINCGSKLGGTWKFCIKCGFDLNYNQNQSLNNKKQTIKDENYENKFCAKCNLPNDFYAMVCGFCNNNEFNTTKFDSKASQDQSEPNLTDHIEVLENNLAPIETKMTNNSYTQKELTKSQKSIFVFVTLFLVSILGLLVANVSKEEVQILTPTPTPTTSPSISYLPSNPYSYEAPKLDDPAKILDRLNSSGSVEWIEDLSNLIGPYAKYQKFIIASYLTDSCAVFVLTDEHSADPLFDNWGKQVDYWIVTDSLTGKFIRIQTKSALNSEFRPCVKAAGRTFRYNLTN